MAKGGSDTFMYASAIFITINIAEAILWVRPNRETMKNVRFFLDALASLELVLRVTDT